MTSDENPREMVKDPPLSADARATSENFQKWRAWWAENKDHAVFVQRPDQSFDSAGDPEASDLTG